MYYFYHYHTYLIDTISIQLNYINQTIFLMDINFLIIQFKNYQNFILMATILLRHLNLIIMISNYVTKIYYSYYYFLAILIMFIMFVVAATTTTTTTTTTINIITFTIDHIFITITFHITNIITIITISYHVIIIINL